MKLFSLPPEAVSGLEALARDLFLADFDLLLIGDGSGTVYHQAAGWGCVAYDRRTQQVIVHAGAASTGTNNFAELIPYMQALWHHHQAHRQTPISPVKVWIVSDSQITVRCGNGQYARKANACLWASIQWFEKNGYRLSWRHVPRNSNVWSTHMDALAGTARRLLLEMPHSPLTEDAHSKGNTASETDDNCNPTLSHELFDPKGCNHEL